MLRRSMLKRELSAAIAERGYLPARVLQMVEEPGGLQAARDFCTRADRPRA